MPKKIASEGTKILKTAADAKSIYGALTCVAAMDPILAGIGLVGLNLAGYLSERESKKDAKAREAEILEALQRLVTDAQNGVPRAFVNTRRSEQNNAAARIAKREGISIEHLRIGDSGLPVYVADAVFKKHISTLAASHDAMAAQVGEIWTSVLALNAIRPALEELAAASKKADAATRKQLNALCKEIRAARTSRAEITENLRLTKEVLAKVVGKSKPRKPTKRDRALYRAACERDHLAANLDAFFTNTNAIPHGSITLRDIFVWPDLLVPQPSSGNEPEATAEKDPASGEELRRHREPPQSVRKPARDVIYRTSLHVILGDPGSGKTTLLQSLLIDHLEKWERDPEHAPMPIFIRLTHWEKAGAPTDFGNYVHKHLSALGLSADVAAELLKRRVIILLDGIDEIRAEENRASIGRILDFGLIRMGGDLALRMPDLVIITSRPSGYRTGMLLGWEETTIAPLTDAQALTHLERYEHIFLKAEKVKRGLPTLLPQILGHPGLAPVARNALFLHLIVFFHRSNMRLPDDRNDFYRYATSVLGDKWLRHRSRDASTPPIKFLDQLLAAIAIQMMRGGIVTLTEPDLRKLVDERLHKAGLNEFDRDTEAKHFVAAARDLIGVIVDKGGDKFGFLHLSFQEFYAADYLLKAREKEYTELAAKHWDDLDWAEVWQLHLSAADGDTDRRELLHDTARANTHPTLDDKLLRCHLTRLKWAGYAGKSRCPLENESVEWAVARICEWGNWSSDWEVCTILTKWERDFDAALRDVLHHKLADSSIFEGYEAIIPALAAHHAGDANLRVTLFAQLEKEDLDIGGAAAKALVALSMREDAQVEGASRPLAPRSVAASSDPHKGGTPPLPAQAPLSIKQELLTRFQSGKGDDYERSALAQGLSGLAGADASLKDALRVRFESGKGDEWERYALAQGLSGLAGADVAVKAALLSRFQSENGHNFERSALAQGLSGLAGANAAVKAALLTRFQSGDGEWKERDALAQGLSGLAGADAAIKAALLARFQSGDGQWRERSALAQGLSGLAGADNGIRAALLNRFKSSSIEPDERGSLAQGLSRLAEKDPEIKKALLLRFQSDGLNGTERHILAHEISKFSDTDTDVQKSMLTRFQSGDGNEYERRALAQGLAPLALRDAGVRSVLIARLKVDTDLHRMSITTATWRVLRVDRLSQP